jgi:hypothetical protein
MNPLQQRIEREASILLRHHDLAVEHKNLGVHCARRLDEFREITGERLPRFRLQFDAVTVAEHETAKTIPFRLVLPFLAGRHGTDRDGLHRQQRRAERKGHDPIMQTTGISAGRNKCAFSPSSCPALCRAPTPCESTKTWMAGTSPAMTA